MPARGRPPPRTRAALTPRALAARNALVEAHRFLAVHIARRLYRASTVRQIGTLDDVIQVGVLGLIHAAEHYDAARGRRFATYAWPCIRGYILSAAHDAGLVHIPGYLWDRMAHGCSDARTAAAQRAKRCRRLPEHWDRMAGSASDQEGPDRAELPDVWLVRAALVCVPARERGLLLQYYGLDGRRRRTVRSLAALHHVSRQTISERLRRARELLRVEVLAIRQQLLRVA